MRWNAQSRAFGAGPATLANIAKLRTGARAVVTGQQVVLLGGPLLTLLKAATAVARARQATAETGIEHVPIFWLATEDHDLEEVDQVSLLSKNAVETLRMGDMRFPRIAMPAGDVILQGRIDGLLDQASELLHHASICNLLRECYAYQPANDNGPTFASAFARLMTHLFAEHGLIVMDAAGREFHALGASTLRFAIEHAEELEAALLARTAELEAAGYHAQVLVKPGASLLFLISEVDGVAEPPGPAPPARRKLAGRSRQAPRPPTPPPSCWRFSTPRPSGSAPTRCFAPSFRTPSCPRRPTSAGRPRSRTSRRAPCSTSAFWAASRRFCRAFRPR